MDIVRIALPLFSGRFGLPIPREVPVRIVFGAPLTFGSGSGVQKLDRKGASREVSDDELREAHEAYVDALTRLFNDNKARFGYANRELCIL